MITLTDRQLQRILVGSEVAISVGEPWDFASKLPADSQGVLYGRVVEVGCGDVPDRSDEAGDPISLTSQTFRLAVTPFEVEGIANTYTVEYLTASARYDDDRGVIEQLAAGVEVEVNLGYEDQLAVEDLPEGESPFLIGGVILAQWWNA